jgi:hypothetical protein
MKKPWILILIAVLFVACGFWIFWPKLAPDKGGGVLITKPKSLAHLPLTQLRKQGAVMIGKLESPMIIDGYPCAANWVHLAESGRLQAFYLSDTCMIQGNQIPKGTWIRLNPDQTIRFCSFPGDTNIQGYICDGGIGGSEGVTTTFYPSGRLSGFYAPNDIEIQGIPCRAGLISGISLHENGYLKAFTLSRDAAIGGRALSAGQRVVLSEDGQIQSVSSPSMIERVGYWTKKLFRWF